MYLLKDKDNIYTQTSDGHCKLSSGTKSFGSPYQELLHVSLTSLYQHGVWLHVVVGSFPMKSYKKVAFSYMWSLYQLKVGAIADVGCRNEMLENFLVSYKVDLLGGWCISNDYILL